jgi:integrase
MSKRQTLQLAFDDWPKELRKRWDRVFETGDFLDDGGPGAHLAPPTRQALLAALGRFLGYLKRTGDVLVDLPPERRFNVNTVEAYIHYRRKARGARTVAPELHHLRLALRLIYPETDWGWLLAATKRFAAQTKPRAKKHHLVTSEHLYELGLALMNEAIKSSTASGKISKADALDYRDGLMISFLAAIPLRRRTFAALRIGQHLLKTGDVWTLDIDAKDTKNKQSLDFSISNELELSNRIEPYLKKFRDCIPGADNHDGLWASNKCGPMDDGAIYDMIRRRTCKAFGFAVNLHRFRHGGVTFWSVNDPQNVKGAKDLLGHASFTTTEKHYIMTQSRVAGRKLAQILDKYRDSRGGQVP